jgi:hypothetical protein
VGHIFFHRIVMLCQRKVNVIVDNLFYFRIQLQKALVHIIAIQRGNKIELCATSPATAGTYQNTPDKNASK